MEKYHLAITDRPAEIFRLADTFALILMTGEDFTMYFGLSYLLCDKLYHCSVVRKFLTITA